MSVEFSNAYQEILLDNLMAVIKQNFVFQTQLKLVENSNNEKSELEKRLKDVTEQYETIKTQISSIDVYKQKAEQNSSAHEEKNRIQSALNDTMKKLSDLQNILNSKNDEISALKKYVLKLEEVVPVTKLNKLKNVKTPEIKNELPKIENKLQVRVIENGSSF